MRNVKYKSNKRKIKILKGYTKEEEMNEPVYQIEEVDFNFIKVYEDLLFNICKLNTLSSNLMLYIAVRMSDDNMIVNDPMFKDDFIKAMADKGISYSRYSIDRAFGDLVGASLIERKTKGLYEVNPKYIWKNTERERIKNIKMKIEFTRDKMNLDIEKELIKDEI